MIGIFDSGLGGLTVVKETLRRLPGLDVVYFGDTARTPYGTKSRDLIRAFAVQDAEFLVSRGAKVIVVACNTASAQAIDAVRAAVRVPVLEVVTPAVEAAARATKGRVGVIGTRGTVKSGVYPALMRTRAPKTAVAVQSCPLFVPLVEEGWASSSEARSIARAYLAPLRKKRIDTLILGCTHYPFLRPVIKAAAGPSVRLVDPARETVRSLAALIDGDAALSSSLSRGSGHRFFVSDRTEHFAALASKWLGFPVALEHADLAQAALAVNPR